MSRKVWLTLGTLLDDLKQTARQLYRATDLEIEAGAAGTIPLYVGRNLLATVCKLERLRKLLNQRSRGLTQKICDTYAADLAAHPQAKHPEAGPAALQVLRQWIDKANRPGYGEAMALSFQAVVLALGSHAFSTPHQMEILLEFHTLLDELKTPQEDSKTDG